MTQDRAILYARGIRTAHIHPPIPDRQFDWRAWHDGEEETQHCGWGKTEDEALADLKRMDDERADYLEWKQQNERIGDGV